MAYKTIYIEYKNLLFIVLNHKSYSIYLPKNMRKSPKLREDTDVTLVTQKSRFKTEKQQLYPIRTVAV